MSTPERDVDRDAEAEVEAEVQRLEKLAGPES